jgi:Rieske Fe-S protein
MSETNTFVSRRRFCANACQVASCAALATVLPGCGSSPTSPDGMATELGVVPGRFSGGSVQVGISGSALTEVGGAALIDSNAGAFLLARTSATTFVAVDATCSHESCTITGSDGNVYVCPCHGSRYSRTGQVVNGPAQASLRQFPTTFADGVVSIAL